MITRKDPCKKMSRDELIAVMMADEGWEPFTAQCWAELRRRQR